MLATSGPEGEDLLTKSTLASGRLGTKRQCLACGAKYYDLGRKPPVCSRCGAVAQPKRAGEEAGAKAVSKEAAAETQRPGAPSRPIGREWSPEQSGAIDQVSRWLKQGEPQVFRLFGYAGVGKTTLARHIAEGARGETAFAAFTGKAALVMRSKGCAGATTIHALIYRASEGAEGAPTFTLNADGPASRAGLIVIDECSMVDAELARDLISFGKPILVLGDPFQLPPVKGGGFFTDGAPDVMLHFRSIARRMTTRSSACPRSYVRAASSRRVSTGRRGSSGAPQSILRRCSGLIRCWSGQIAPVAPITSGCATSVASASRCRSPATVWSACATTARRASSTGGYGALRPSAGSRRISSR